MASVDKLNFGFILQESLTKTLLSEVEDRIVKNMVDDFKVKAREIVREQVKKVSLDQVDCIRDLAKVRDEVHVYLNWKGDL